MHASAETTLTKTCPGPCQPAETDTTRGREEISIPADKVREADISHASDTQDVNRKSFYWFVENKGLESVGDDPTGVKAVTSFLSVKEVPQQEGAAADERQLRRWLAYMVGKGLAKSTLRRYLGKIHVLYSGFCGESESGQNLFKALREETDNDFLRADFPLRDAMPFVKKIPYRIHLLGKDEAETAKMLLFLLSLGGRGFGTAIDAKFGDVMPDIDQVQSIASLQSESQRKKYLFGLGQGKKRPSQISVETARSVSSLLSALGYTQRHTVSSETVAGWWIEGAMSAGVPVETVAALLPHIPKSHAWLKLVKPAVLTETQRLEALRKVAGWFNPMTPRWYALNLRGNNTPHEIRALLDEKDKALSKAVKFFYPTKTQFKKVGKKKIKEDVPVIRQILFVRTQPDKVLPLMKTVGELAWCYKVSHTAGAPYSVISQKEMNNFQKLIGVFDEDTKLEFVRDINLFRGRKVRITGGIYAGQEGVIIREDKKGTGGNLRTFILKLSNTQGIRWQADIGEHYLESL